jgi:ubiquinone/menaquinone biosynthesis C-methylase UbiE
MGFYEQRILPKFINKACAAPPILKQREKVVPQAEGRVLEIGMGSGLNLPFYNPDKVEMVFGLEPSEGMRKLAAPVAEAAPFEVRFLDLPGEEIPLEDDSVDTIVLTYTLCTIPDGPTALAQMRRVLKPGGKMVFSEHGKAPDAAVQKWQNRINPVWKLIGGGCHINKPIDTMIEGAGFKMDKLETLYLPETPQVFGFNYWGFASI